MTPKLSASLVLVSPAKKVLFMLRPSRGSYRNTYVFPGGAQDAEDVCSVHCALRETYEETGILIDPTTKKSILVKGAAEQDYPTALKRYMGCNFSEIDWRNDAGFARASQWTTPVQANNKRFTTQFFLYNAPEEFDLSWFKRSSEAEALLWISPSDALAKFNKGEFSMFPPQAYIMTLLKHFGQERAIEHMKDRVIHPKVVSQQDDGTIHYDWGANEEGIVQFVKGQCISVKYVPKL